MASALDVQSTFGAQPPANFSYADAAAVAAPRPSVDLADTSAGDYQPIAEGDADTADATLMALAGSEPNGPAPAVPVAIASAPADSQTTASIQDATTTGTVAADAGAIDPATARIYGAAAAGGYQPAAPTPLVPQARRTGGLLALFSGNRANTARNALQPPAPMKPQGAELWAAPSNSVAPLVPQTRTASLVAASAGGSTLPGVDRDRALGLNEPSGQPVIESEEEGRPIQLASAAGLARLAPNGLITQRDDVQIACLKPALVRVLKDVERHYGKKVVVTSGYRDPSRNKQASGAENSLHMYCSAADIQIEGVSKIELASYLRDMPGRGGVGTYCYTESVHIDIGPQRDWNWRCRRRK